MPQQERKRGIPEFNEVSLLDPNREIIIGIVSYTLIDNGELL